MTITKDVPPEIWKKIVDFVPRSHHRPLCAVNRTLFYIVLGIRYETIHLGDFCDSRNMQALRNSVVSGSIKRLLISLHSLGKLLKHPPKRHPWEQAHKDLAKLPLPILKMFENCLSEPSFSLEGRFPALQEVRVEFIPTRDTALHHGTFHEIYESLIQTSLWGISQKLRILSLSIPSESYHYKSFNVTRPFPVLEQLELTIFTIYLTTDYEEVLESTLAPFVNAHSTTLRSLSITVEPRFSFRDRYFYRSHRFLRAVRHLPGLSSFKLQLQMTGPQQTELAGLCHFIRAHSATLTTLHLSLFNSIHYRYNDDCWEPEDSVITELFVPHTLFSHDLFTKVIPSCRMVTDFKFETLFESSLERSPGLFATWFTSRNWFENLVTLTLPHNRLLLSDFLDIILAVDLPILRNLDVHLSTLTTLFFDTLEPRLQRLRQLRIRTPQLEPKVDANSTQHILAPRSTFLRDLEESSYLSWTSLIDIDIQLTTNPALGGAPLHLRAALMSAFPNLLYCNETPQPKVPRTW